MGVKISPENQHLVDNAIAEGRFSSPDEALNEAFRLLREELRRNGMSPPGIPETQESQESQESWSGRFDAWADSHGDIEAVADDSRESIYHGQGH